MNAIQVYPRVVDAYSILEIKFEMMCCHRLLEEKMYFYCVMIYLFLQSTSGKLS